MGELLSISPALQALLAGLMTWGLTALGAAAVLLLHRERRAALDAMLAFGAGVMLAASYFSLLAPALDWAVALGQQPVAVVALGFFLGGVVLLVADALLSRALQTRAALPDSRRRVTLLTTAITLHNIPEGLAIGVSFGATSRHPAALAAAWMLALGVGLQNLPEGAAISLPLRREGMSPGRAFFIGQASALVEPVAAVLGALLAVHVRAVLPFVLSFAAGAMVLVVIDELIPEARRTRCPAVMSLFTIIGFTLMMVMDVALG